MRVFETLSCGKPLVTNSVPHIEELIDVSNQTIRYYSSLAEIEELIESVLNDEDFLTSGVSARKWIQDNATYEHRVRTILSCMERKT
jgi:spore maturation protein CgeB